MGLLRCTSALVLLTIGFAGAAYSQTEKTFPTDDEINLVLTQTDRAMQQYKPLIDQEEIQMGKSCTDAAANDLMFVVNSLEMAVKSFKRKPQAFDGPQPVTPCPCNAFALCVLRTSCACPVFCRRVRQAGLPSMVFY